MSERATEQGDQTPSKGADVFISYSRVDGDFVRRLQEGLAARGQRAWVDWQDIPPTAEWMGEIRVAIDSCNAYVSVLSPDSMHSKVCSAELQHAIDSNKRIIPVLRREVDQQSVPDAVSKLNWVFIRDEDDFDQGVEKLVSGIETDLDRVRAHTRLLVRSRQWEDTGEDQALLLRGSELREAETFVAFDAEPLPTQAQTRFVLASRKASARRQRGTVTTLAALLLVMALLAVVAFQQRSSAVTNQRVAEERARESRSRELATAARDQLGNDPELSLLLSVEAMSSARTPEALETLRQSLTDSTIRARLQGHVGAVTHVAYSPDGTRLLTAGDDGIARMWDTKTDQTVLILKGHEDIITSASFSPDAARVLTSSFDGTVRIWDATSGGQIEALDPHAGAMWAARWSPDGHRVVTAGGDGAVRIWDPSTGRELAQERRGARPVFDASFSPDGSLVVAASDDGTATVFSARSGKVVHVLAGHTDGLYTAAFSPDGTEVVTSSQDRTARVWDAGTGRLITALVGSDGPVVSASFSSDGRRVLTASWDATARVWDASTGRQIVSLRSHDRVNAAAFSPEGDLVITASEDGSAAVWDARIGTQLATLRGHDGPVLAASFSHDGTLVATGGRDTIVRIWEPISGRVLYRGGWSWLSGFQGDSDRIAVLNSGGDIKVFDAATGKPVSSVRAGPETTFAALSHDGTVIAGGGSDGLVKTWDVDSGKRLAIMHGHEPGYMNGDFYSADDHLLTWSDDGTARLWDPRSGDQLQVFEHGDPQTSGGVWEAHLSSDGTRVLTTGVFDGVARMFDATSGKELWSIKGLAGTGGIGADISPDGSLVVTTNTGGTFVWDAADGHKVATLGDPASIRGAFFSHDSQRLLTRSDDGAARVWDSRTGRLLAEMPGHPSTVETIDFSHDGQWAVTTADDGKARVWSASTGDPVATFGGEQAGWAPAFFTAGDAGVVSGSDQSIRLDRCDACRSPDALMDLARTRLTRSLTPLERSTFLGDPKPAAPPHHRREGLEDERGPVHDGILDPGTYSAVGFDPKVSFTVDDGWQATTFLDWGDKGEVQLGTLVQLQRLDSPTSAVSIIWLGHTRVQDGHKDWDEPKNIEPFPPDFATWLAGHPNLTTRTRHGTEVGGVNAVSVDTIVTSTPANSWSQCGGGCVTEPVFSLHDSTGPINSDGDLIGVLGPGEVDRWIRLQDDNDAILIDVFAVAQQDFRRFWPIARELIDSIRVGE